MLTCTRLRIDRPDGSAALEYRIENGCVEIRVPPQESTTRSGRVIEWLRLTAEQLSGQVESNPILSRWLQRRMGVQRMLRACTTFRQTLAACSGY